MLPGAPTIYQTILDHPTARRLRPVVAAARHHRCRRRARSRWSSACRPSWASTRCSPRYGHDRGRRGHHVPHRRRPGTVATTLGPAVPGMRGRAIGDQGEILLRGAERDARLPRRPRGDRRRPSTPTAGCTPATSAPSTTRGYLDITDRLKDMYISRRLQRLPRRDRADAGPAGRRRRVRRDRHPRRADGRGRAARTSWPGPDTPSTRRRCWPSARSGSRTSRCPAQCQFVNSSAAQPLRQGAQERPARGQGMTTPDAGIPVPDEGEVVTYEVRGHGRGRHDEPARVPQRAELRDDLRPRRAPSTAPSRTTRSR